MSKTLDNLYEFAKAIGFTEEDQICTSEMTPALKAMADFRIFPNTVRDIKAEVDARIAELTAEVEKLREALSSVLMITLPLDQDDANVIAIARNALKDGV